MPTYNFLNNKTQKIKTEFMSISEMETYLVENPNMSLVLSTPSIVSGVDGLRKPDNAFRDLLGRIKRNNRRSTIDTR